MRVRNEKNEEESMAYIFMIYLFRVLGVCVIICGVGFVCYITKMVMQSGEGTIWEHFSEYFPALLAIFCGCLLICSRKLLETV